mmetsp:Transcript_15457/g.33558  ORF Transcript_15457/g.33558 Transcript_15457/m.33558 type:complete len:304 (-) Transcript_15457:2-913(-)
MLVRSGIQGEEGLDGVGSAAIPGASDPVGRSITHVLRIPPAVPHDHHLVFQHHADVQHPHVELGAGHLQNLLLCAGGDKATISKIGIGKIHEGSCVRRRLHPFVMQIKHFWGNKGIRLEQGREILHGGGKEVVENHLSLVILCAFKTPALLEVQQQCSRLVDPHWQYPGHLFPKIHPAPVLLQVLHRVAQIPQEGVGQDAPALGGREGLRSAGSLGLPGRRILRGLQGPPSDTSVQDLSIYRTQEWKLECLLQPYRHRRRTSSEHTKHTEVLGIAQRRLQIRPRALEHRVVHGSARKNIYCYA